MGKGKISGPSAMFGGITIRDPKPFFGNYNNQGHLGQMNAPYANTHTAPPPQTYQAPTPQPAPPSPSPFSFTFNWPQMGQQPMPQAPQEAPYPAQAAMEPAPSGFDFGPPNAASDKLGDRNPALEGLLNYHKRRMY